MGIMLLKEKLINIPHYVENKYHLIQACKSLQPCIEARICAKSGFIEYIYQVHVRSFSQ